jgi:DNA-binding HxlR family transcriptional regulator
MSAPDSSDSTGRNGLSEASLFESIAHEARIKILYLLQNEPLGFSELKRKLGLTSSGNLQHHINKLGVLIESNADGQYTLTDNGREAIMAIQAIRGMQDRPKIIMRGMIFFWNSCFLRCGADSSIPHRDRKCMDTCQCVGHFDCLWNHLVCHLVCCIQSDNG